MKILNYLKNGIETLLELAGILAGILIAAIGLLVTAGVAARYFNLPSYWVVPYSVYTFIAASFLGAAYAMKKSEHIRVDILLRTLPSKTRNLVNFCTALLALAFFVYLSWRSFVMTRTDFINKTTDLSLLEIYIWIPKSFVFLGSVLMCLSLIWYMLNEFPVKDDRPPVDQVER